MDAATAAAPPADWYVLVHPEQCPEPSSIHPTLRAAAGDPWVEALLAGFDGVYQAEIAATAAARRLLIDDGTIQAINAPAAVPSSDPDLWTDLLGPAWERVSAQPHELGRVRLPIPAGSRVQIAGFHRQDCVRRVAARLRRAGCQVTIHAAATLPLTAAALIPYWSKVPPPST